MSQILIWKCRFSWVGSIGDCMLCFDKATSRYISTEDMETAEDMLMPDKPKYKKPPIKSYYEKEDDEDIPF